MIEVELRHCRIPLISPYVLSFGSVHHFDSLLCVMRHGQKEVVAEATALPGYSWETIGGMWNTAEQLIRECSTLDLLTNRCKTHLHDSPFAITPITTAIHKLLHPISYPDLSIPLVGIISGSAPAAIEQSVQTLQQEGFKTLKLKVAGKLDEDLEKLRVVGNTLQRDTIVRIDANQGYAVGDALRFVENLDPSWVELFEQPFKPDLWSETAELNRRSPVPIMLDESIWTAEHIHRAMSDSCARYVKLKMVKHGGFNETMRLLDLAQSLGIGVIFGNGVQTAIGCADEAVIYHLCGCNSTAECNGWLKQAGDFTKGLVVESGNLRLSSSFAVDLATLEQWTVRSKMFKCYL
ncbi:MAG: dipeptide epimerase [Salibacteraceae bacterium]